jgi:hypothetical protein
MKKPANPFRSGTLQRLQSFPQSLANSANVTNYVTPFDPICDAAADLSPLLIANFVAGSLKSAALRRIQTSSWPYHRPKQQQACSGGTRDDQLQQNPDRQPRRNCHPHHAGGQ